MKQKLVLNFKTSNDVSGMQKDHKKKRKKRDSDKQLSEGDYANVSLDRFLSNF